MSPGQIYEPEGHGRDWWRTARALHAAGFRAGDLVANAFAYHFTPAGSMLESGALACGCTVVPTGVGQTEMQVSTIADLGVNGYIGTPSFLKLIVEKAAELKVDISCLKKAVVGAEYLPPALRDAMAERGIERDAVLRDCRSGTRSPTRRAARTARCARAWSWTRASSSRSCGPAPAIRCPPGEVGEVVVTSFNPDYPLIRFATGDLSAVLAGPSPCGRTNVRIKGWMGRADQATKVKGMFVQPAQVAEVLKRHPEIRRARLVVDQADGQDRMTLHCEVESAPAGLAEAVVATIRDVTKLRGEVTLRKPGELPNDGKVVEDARKYE